MQSTHRYNSYLYEPVRITRIRITPKISALTNPSFTNKISRLPESTTATAGVIRPCSSHPCSMLGAYNSARPVFLFKLIRRLATISGACPGFCERVRITPVFRQVFAAGPGPGNGSRFGRRRLSGRAVRPVGIAPGGLLRSLWCPSPERRSLLQHPG